MLQGGSRRIVLVSGLSGAHRTHLPELKWDSRFVGDLSELALPEGPQ